MRAGLWFRLVLVSVGISMTLYYYARGESMFYLGFLFYTLMAAADLLLYAGRRYNL